MLSVSSDELGLWGYTSFSQHILYTLVSDGAKKNIMLASRIARNGICILLRSLCLIES